VRLFIGLPLPREHRKILNRHLEPWREQFPRLKWVDPSLTHFTLQFLGEVNPEKVDALAARLEHLSSRPDFTLETGGIFTMPLDAIPRMLALGLLSGVAPLRDLVADVHVATEWVGFKP
jgi:RNA 2',3'-cyclic 3'-phosphodiesterase